MLKLIVIALALLCVTALPDNDNYILYAGDIGGHPVLSSDGYLFMIGPNITKINMVSKVAEREIELYADTTSKVSSMSKGVLNSDESFLVIYSDRSGPNCARLLTVTTSDMQLRQDN